MNPDEALGGVATRLNDLDLIANDAATNGVAADRRACVARGACGGAQDLRLAIGDPIIAGAELNEAGPHAALLDLPVQLAQHPVA